MIAKQRRAAGDTIVEVLIAIAVASGVLGSAFVLTNHTFRNARQAQEHTEALGIAQGQIERLSSLPSPTGYFCVDDSGTVIPEYGVSSGQPADDFNYNSACKKDFGRDYSYNIAVYYFAGTPKHYQVYITWPSVISSGNDHVSLSYRVGPAN